jgi:aminoglycoside phosphotransferase (APT) family kinase protein
MDPFGSSLVPLEGGWSGQTFLAEAAGERTVVRVYARPGPRGEAAHEVDAALLQLVRGLVPVPEVLEVRRAGGDGMPALLVTSFLPGERADLLMPRLDEAGLATLGRNLGALLARLAGMPMLRVGIFVDGDLRIDPFEAGDLDLTTWVSQHELGLAPGELAGVDEVAEQAQADLDTVRRVSLVHSDLNPKNLLVDPDTLAVTGLVDWEFAHAGSPYADLGNLLRFEREPAFADAVLGEYAERLEEEPRRALDLARAADLFALIELASRRGQNPMADRAHAQLRAIGVHRDRHATAEGLPA